MTFGIVNPIDWKKIVQENDITARGNDESDLLQSIIDSINGILINTDHQIPVLCLSGGLDSSILAVLMAKLYPSIHCLTIGSNGDHPDVYYSHFLTRKFNISHTIFYQEPYLEKKDMYEVLFNICHNLGYRSVVCGDTIDEQLGGYWQHQKPGVFLEKENINNQNPKQYVFKMFWDQLITNHLEPMNYWSQNYQISVHLPYLQTNIIKAVQNYDLEQRVDDNHRKKPLIGIANRLYIPENIINRRKKGLVDALKTF